MKITKIISKIIAAALAAMIILCSVAAAGAAGTDTDAYREAQLQKFEEMKNREISVRLWQEGFYILKHSKLYARKVTGVADDGSFILGPWELVNHKKSVCFGSEYFNIPGTCVNFAYSFDITGGTDWPFTGIFWTEINPDIRHLTIRTGGGCRNASIQFYYNDEISIFRKTNLSGHKEWKP